MDDATLAATRRSLHAVAELVLAGPQYRAHGTIRLRVTPGGFGTVAGPELRVDGAQLVAQPDGAAAVSVRPAAQLVGAAEVSVRLDIAGHSCAELAAAAGRQPSALRDLYRDATDVAPDDVLHVDAAAAAWLAECWAAGDGALRCLAPAAEPVLWPEHFDVAIRTDDTNFGVSPGDAAIPEPYAYVGPPAPRDGPFWNQPFGAARSLRELGARQEAVLAFFTEGRERIAAGT